MLRFLFSYVLIYVLRVKFDNMLIIFLSMSFLFSICIGVNHLIVFETNRTNRKAFFTSTCLVRLPVRPSFIAAPAFSRLHVPHHFLFCRKNVFVSSWRVCPTKKEEDPGCDTSTLGVVMNLLTNKPIRPRRPIPCKWIMNEI